MKEDKTKLQEYIEQFVNVLEKFDEEIKDAERLLEQLKGQRELFEKHFAEDASSQQIAETTTNALYEVSIIKIVQSKTMQKEYVENMKQRCKNMFSKQAGLTSQEYCDVFEDIDGFLKDRKALAKYIRDYYAGEIIRKKEMVKNLCDENETAEIENAKKQKRAEELRNKRMNEGLARMEQRELLGIERDLDRAELKGFRRQSRLESLPEHIKIHEFYKNEFEGKLNETEGLQKNLAPYIDMYYDFK